MMPKITRLPQAKSRADKPEPIVVFWLRRDLRLRDNHGLFSALKSGFNVVPVFIFDREILSKFPDRDDRRVAFIYKTLLELKSELTELGADLWVEHGEPAEVFENLFKKFEIKDVYSNHDYEPSALARDARVQKICEANGARLLGFKDHVIFERLEVTKDDGKPYTVYTPYARKWRARLGAEKLAAYASQGQLGHLLPRHKWSKGGAMPQLAELGFPEAPIDFDFPPAEVSKAIVLPYKEQRDYPAIAGTSHLGLHLRFGTVSVRELVTKAREWNDTWYGELIWREFFIQIMANFPHVVSGPFRPEYDKIKWRHDKADFQKWCNGTTGVPIVDAGMRELNATGFMHNRVRMITASYLAKSLLIDYRWGEFYFARKLLDFDLASNNGNWQWVAGCGCDAAPYFRIFNPELQEKRFDREQVYIKTWVPEVGSSAYMEPMVDHKTSRMRTLAAYAKGLGKKAPDFDP